MTDPTAAVIHLGRLALKFGEVDRITYHEDGVTLESDTDHTVMLGLIACALADRYTDLNVGLVAQYALLHDLVEVYAGDTPTLRTQSADAKTEKAARECAAQHRLAAELRDLPWVGYRIEQYEERRSPEARFVKALDKLLPKITHVLNGLVTVRTQGMTAEQLAERYEAQFDELMGYAADFPILFELRADLVAQVLALAPAALDGVAA